jgi:hypothetical protein
MRVHAARHRARGIDDGHGHAVRLAGARDGTAAQQRGGGAIALLAQGDPPH